MQKCIWYSPVVVCFAALRRNFRLLFCKNNAESKRKPQIPRVKKAYRRLFCAGAAPMTQPLFTCRIDQMPRLRRYSVGVTPVICLKTRLKFRIPEKPHWRKTEVTSPLSCANSAQARSMRKMLRNFLKSIKKHL